MIKICVIHSFNMSFEKWRKYGHFSREVKFYKELSKKRFEISFISYGPKDNKKDLEKYNFDIINLSNFNIKNNIIIFFYSIYLLFKNKEKIKNIDFFKTNQLSSSYLAILIKFFFKKKIIIRAGYEPNILFSFNKISFFKKFFFYVNSYLAYLYADKIIVTSSNIKEYIIKKFRVNQNKIFVIGNYIDTNLFSYNKKKKIELKFLTISRLSSEKNLDILINVFNKNDLNLTIIGHGDFKNFLNEKKIELINKNINHSGFIKNENLPKKLKNFDFFILLSNNEGNPKALLETMSMGIIPIVNNVDGLNNIVKHNYNGFLIGKNYENIESFLSNIKNLDKSLLNNISNNASLYIRENYGLEKILLEEKKIYE